MDIFHITTQETLERISRHCPEALSTFFQCINRMDNHGEIYFSRNSIDVDMSEDFRSFRNNIKKLARENLLTWVPAGDGLSIVMIGENENV